MKAQETRNGAQSRIGRNVKDLRQTHHIAREGIAAEMRHYGLKWSANRVTDLERGDKVVSIDELVVLAHALSKLSGQRVDIADLLSGGGAVTVGSVNIEAETFAGYFRGEPVDLSAADHQRFQQMHQTVTDLGIYDDQPNETDQSVARKLGVTPEEVSKASYAEWGRGLTDQRERLLRTDDNPSARTLQARRGRITTTLQKRIKERLETVNNDQGEA